MITFNKILPVKMSMIWAEILSMRLIEINNRSCPGRSLEELKGKATQIKVMVLGHILRLVADKIQREFPNQETSQSLELCHGKRTLI